MDALCFPGLEWRSRFCDHLRWQRCPRNVGQHRFGSSMFGDYDNESANVRKFCRDLRLTVCAVVAMEGLREMSTVECRRNNDHMISIDGRTCMDRIDVRLSRGCYRCSRVESVY
jgi:hypothetical protein